MARRSKWSEAKHPRDRRGRFSRAASRANRATSGRGGYKAGRGGVGGNTRLLGQHAARGAKGSQRLGTRKQRLGQAAITTALVGGAGLVLPVGGGVAVLVARRHVQRKRGQVGLRSTVTGRLLN